MDGINYYGINGTRFMRAQPICGVLQLSSDDSELVVLVLVMDWCQWCFLVLH